METQPHTFSNIYTSSITGVGGGIIGTTEVPKEEDKPAIMVNLLIELTLEDTDNQKDVEKEFLRRLVAFSKSSSKMSIKLVKQPRDYHDYEVIKIS
jgi:hypothetical protein